VPLGASFKGRRFTLFRVIVPCATLLTAPINGQVLADVVARSTATVSPR